MLLPHGESVSLNESVPSVGLLHIFFFLLHTKCPLNTPSLPQLPLRKDVPTGNRDKHGSFWERRCHATGNHTDAPGAATTFSYLTHSDLIPLLLNEPLDHPANLCRQINSRRSRKKKKRQGQHFSLLEIFEAAYQQRAIEQDRCCWPQWPLCNMVDSGMKWELVSCRFREAVLQ